MVTCVPVSNVVTNVGTTGTEVLVTIPLSLLGAAAGTSVSGIVVTSTLLAPAAPPQDVDSITLPDGVLAGPIVRIGVAAPGVPAEAVSYTSAVTPVAGSFSAAFTGPSDGSAAVLWAQPCVGDTCGPAMQWPLNAVLPAQLNSVVSRKLHGAAGPFDVDLTSGNGVECRSGGTSGDYTLVFNFANPLLAVDSVSITSGNGSVGASNVDGNDTHNYIVNLTGVTNGQVLTVSLTNVTDSAGEFSASVPIAMGVLLGDVNGSGRVDAADVSSVRQQTLQAIDASNFRDDVDVSGRIDAADVSIARQQTLTSLR